MRGARVASHRLREEAARPRDVSGVGRRRRYRRLFLEIRGLGRALLVETERVAHGRGEASGRVGGAVRDDGRLALDDLAAERRRLLLEVLAAVPHVQVGALHLLRDERVELQCGAQPGAHFVLVLDFEQGLKIYIKLSDLLTITLMGTLVYTSHRG